jgi:hypothetical protein
MAKGVALEPTVVLHMLSDLETKFTMFTEIRPSVKKCGC